jgi:hypothetical protein
MTTRLHINAPAARRRGPVWAVVVLLVAAACGGGDQAVATSTNAPNPAGHATLVLDGTPLAFQPSVCSAGPVDFAATGTGRMGDRPFVVTVRKPDVFVVKFGVDDELDVPPEGERWLYGIEGTELRSDGTVISGSARLADVRALDLAVVEARIDLRCD